MTEPSKKIRNHPGPGFRIRARIERPCPDLSRQLARYATPDISDLLNGLFTLSPLIRGLVRPERILGPACTVKVPPHDNLMLHKALDIAQPGDVLVVDAGGSPHHATCGDMISQKALHRGISGLIIDGWIRDLPGLEAIGLPVFARGVTPVAPQQQGPGEINYPISCGGIVVHPGDLMIGDCNGLVAVPREALPDLLARLSAWEAQFTPYQQAVRAGDFDNAWIDDLLEQAGFEMESLINLRHELDGRDLLLNGLDRQPPQQS